MLHVFPLQTTLNDHQAPASLGARVRGALVQLGSGLFALGWAVGYTVERLLFIAKWFSKVVVI